MGSAKLGSSGMRFWGMCLIVVELLAVSLGAGAASAQEDARPQDAYWQNAYCINPRIPMRVRRNQTAGTVSLLFDITADGRPTNIRVIAAKADGDNFAEAALARNAEKALQEWEYFAYIKDGVEAPRSNIEVTFRFLKSDARPAELSGVEACTTSMLPAPPSHAGDPRDPLVNLARCWRPSMPYLADQAKQSAVVEVRFNVDEAGTIQDIRLAPAQERNAYAEQALSALSKWKYHPFMRLGEPVTRVDLALEISFGEPPAPGMENACSHAPFGSSVSSPEKKCSITIDHKGEAESSPSCGK